MKTKIKPEPNALRAAIIAAENWGKDENSYKCEDNYYRNGIYRDPLEDIERDTEYGGPAIAYWAVATVEHREEILKTYPEKSMMAMFTGVDSTISFLRELALGDNYTKSIDAGNFYFLEHWKKHLEE